eukprot:1149853-Pelagomonas_calceolata.AAC.8
MHQLKLNLRPGSSRQAIPSSAPYPVGFIPQAWATQWPGMSASCSKDCKLKQCFFLAYCDLASLLLLKAPGIALIGHAIHCFCPWGWIPFMLTLDQHCVYLTHPAQLFACYSMEPFLRFWPVQTTGLDLRAQVSASAANWKQLVQALIDHFDPTNSHACIAGREYEV